MNIYAIIVLALVCLVQLACGIPVAAHPSTTTANPSDQNILLPANIAEYLRYLEQIWSSMKRPDSGNRNGHHKHSKPSDRPTPTTHTLLPVDMPTITAPKVPSGGYLPHTATPLFTTYDASDLLTR
ncbi:hypothetical protein GGI21_004681, partial [Coemansia aciculifera]